MHSRIYVLRQVEDGKKLPSIKDCSCVTEDELADSFVPTHADYVSLIEHDEHWMDNIDWITNCYKGIFCSIKDKDETFLALDISKGYDFLKSQFKKFQDLAKEITEADFCSTYSMNMYDLKLTINDESGFWIITISESEGWWYDTIDSFLRSNCSPDSKNKIKFRVEDIFDYHY